MQNEIQVTAIPSQYAFNILRCTVQSSHVAPAFTPASISNLAAKLSIQIVTNKEQTIERVNLQYFIFNHILKIIIVWQKLTPLISLATDFGILGQTFKVTEEPFTQMLKKRLAGIDIDKEQSKIQTQVKE